jgi:hypothetical protein
MKMTSDEMSSQSTSETEGKERKRRVELCLVLRKMTKVRV